MKIKLIGMAPPKITKSDKINLEPFWTKNLQSNLIPLDPRHGVFPNLVMTPLFSILLFLKDDNKKLKFLEISKNIIINTDEKLKFNVWKADPSKEEQELNLNQILMPIEENEFWLTFGYSTYFAILRTLIKKDKSDFKNKLMKKEAEKFGKELSNRLLKNKAITKKFKIPSIPSNKVATLGCYFRIAIMFDIIENNNNLITALCNEFFEDENVQKKELVKNIMKIIPLPHNEVYQNKPIAWHQNSFMLRKDLSNSIDDIRNNSKSNHYFYSYIGKYIARRIKKYLQ